MAFSWHLSIHLLCILLAPLEQRQIRRVGNALAPVGLASAWVQVVVVVARV